MLPFRKRLRGWWWRRLPPETVCKLRQRRIYLLPTRFGVLLLLVAAAVWVGALNYAVSLAYGLAFWIISLVLLAVLMAFRQLAGLQLQVEAGENTFLGQVANCRLLLINPAGVERQIHLRAEEGDSTVHCQLPAGGQQSVSIPLLLNRRGPHAYPVMQIWSTAPLGLIRAFSWWRPDATVLAYPHPLPDRVRHADGLQAGKGRSGGEDEEDFSHLAEYQVGDTPRQIAWSLLARRDVLASKRFVSQPRGTAVHELAWQDYPAALDGETRLSRLCWRLLQCEKAGQRYRVRLPDTVIEPQAGQRERALAALANCSLPS
ncbi:DUF58 domain-containing protein [Aquitalea sp. LB_tupeE]|uniref:DUF58 domain-containing protein n=1 Tax=Aquitalea sp. LB_tupeE TaxID=2748078 RepID=UPI002102E228|nr:DUF58 domain-containing protein [Aquitalea sp. LB_tupeE]